MDFIWRAVRDARWKGYMANGFVADVFSIYMGWHVPYVAKFTKHSLRIQVPTDKVDEFRNAFPDAEKDKLHGTHGLTMLTLEIPKKAQQGEPEIPSETHLKGKR